MELLDRYLNAVRANLPKDQADDIVAEIADDIQSQADEREAMVHRGLSRDEEAELLKAYGHPRVVAARYAKVQYLIGPELLPFYWYSLRMVLIVVVALGLAGGLIGALAAGDPTIFSRSLGFVWDSIFIVVGIITVIFALIERVPSKASPLDRIGITKWNPRTLPVTGAVQAPRVNSFFEALANGFFAVVLLNIHAFERPIDAVMLGTVTPNFYHFTPAWAPLYVVLIVSSLALAVTGIVTFVQPHLVVIRRAILVVANVVVIVGAAMTLSGGQLVAPTQPALNELGVWALYCGIALAGFNAAFNAWHLMRVRTAQLSGRLA